MIGIDRDQPRVERAPDDAGGAELVGGRAGHGVVGNAAAGRAVGDGVVGDLRVVRHSSLPGRGIEADDDAHRRTDEERVADLERRVLRRVALLLFVLGQSPVRNSQTSSSVGDILGRDLGERRVALRAIRAAVGRPVGAGIELHAPVRALQRCRPAAWASPAIAGSAGITSAGGCWRLGLRKDALSVEQRLGEAREAQDEDARDRDHRATRRCGAPAQGPAGAAPGWQAAGARGGWSGAASRGTCAQPLKPRSQSAHTTVSAKTTR